MVQKADCAVQTFVSDGQIKYNGPSSALSGAIQRMVAKVNRDSNNPILFVKDLLEFITAVKQGEQAGVAQASAGSYLIRDAQYLINETVSSSSSRTN